MDNYNETLASLGRLNAVISNERYVKKIVSYIEDTGLLEALILAINEGLKKGELSDMDMQYLRTGALMQTILSLPEDERLKEKREVTSEEVINKIKVLNNIEDQEIKDACFTNPRFLNYALNKNIYPRYISKEAIKACVNDTLYMGLSEDAKKAYIRSCMRFKNNEMREYLEGLEENTKQY